MKTRSIGRTSDGVGGPDQVDIGLVGIHDAAVAIGDQDAVEGAVDQPS